uniref:Putative secreted protein n=1 Tax=Anopheles darlingi TaxID=43151 RepID=A0A2M4DA06_ANODA
MLFLQFLNFALIKLSHFLLGQVTNLRSFFYLHYQHLIDAHIRRIDRRRRDLPVRWAQINVLLMLPPGTRVLRLVATVLLGKLFCPGNV